MDNNNSEVISEERQEELKEACKHFEKKYTKKVFRESLKNFILNFNNNRSKEESKLSNDGIIESTIDRAFGLKQPIVSKSLRLSMNKVFDRYLEQYSRETSTAFPANVVNTLCNNAGCLCSNPECRTYTCCQDPTDPFKTIIVGRAHHIRKPDPRKRYDTTAILEFNSILNGIWLCGDCDQHIYLRGVREYPEERLKEWKNIHNHYLWNSRKWPINRLPSFTRPAADVKKCGDIIAYLEQSAILHKRVQQINTNEARKEARSIITFLTAMRKTTNPRSPIYQILQAMAGSCRSYISFTKGHPDELQIHYHQNAISKMTGLCLLQMQNIYRVRITGKNKKLLPVFKGGKVLKS